MDNFRAANATVKQLRTGSPMDPPYSVCGPLSGGGMHDLLEKIDGRWREAEPPGLLQCVWAS